MNIDELISELKLVKTRLANETTRKNELEAAILSIVPYNPLGQKTIETAQYKIKVSAGIDYRVNEDIASQYSECFPPDMHPLEAVTKYKVDAKKYKQLLMYPELRGIAAKFVIEVPKSVSIKVL